MYNLLSVKKVRLLTNNPKKLETLEKLRIEIVERVPIVVGRNAKNKEYLKIKEKKLGHLLS